MLRALIMGPVVAALVLVQPAWADARMTVLVDVLKLREAMQILREEGVQYAQELNTEMLGGQGGAGWQQQVDAIYDVERMVEMVRGSLSDHLDGEPLEEVITFYASDLGQQIITLENSARAAISEREIEEAARERYRDIAAGEGDETRLQGLKTFVEDGDMLNRNVTSAMNSNYQFLRGMADGDALEMTDEEILSDVTGDMEEIRTDTEEWLFGYFLMAYHPLSEDEMTQYIAFSATPAGKALNAGLFEGFGQAYEDISYALGRAVALNMLAEEL